MGCDIHCHFEIKLDNVWHHYSSPRIRRNYELFSKMADVRNYNSIEPLCQPKGLPNDLSVITKFEYDLWKLDAHSMSWFNIDEIKEAIDYHEKISVERKIYLMDEWGYLCGNCWDTFKEYRSDYPEEIQDIRLIFWFDN